MSDPRSRRALVLASTSPFRRALLARLGVEHVAAAPPFEEIASATLAPAERARRFAAGKALSLAPAFPDALVIGADQVLAIEGEVLSKTTSPADAEAQLARLSGRAHALHSAVALHDTASGRLEVELATAYLHMRSLDATQIAAYVARDQPVGSAGGYLFEGRGIALFEGVWAEDDSVIVGLPLMTLARMLRRFGVEPLGGDGPGGG